MLSSLLLFSTITSLSFAFTPKSIARRHFIQDENLVEVKRKFSHPSSPLQIMPLREPLSSSTPQQEQEEENTFTLFNDLDNIYTSASITIKCPFIKRRVADTIDNVSMILRFLIVRHKSLLNVESSLDLLDDTIIPNLPTMERRSMMLPVTHKLKIWDAVADDVEVIPGCKAIGRHVLKTPDGNILKHRGLPMDVIRNIIIKDWAGQAGPGPENNHKGYYITGKLNSTIYRDDCLFDGPDPDMPVRGLRKYLSAASNLFDAKHSRATLLSLETIQEATANVGTGAGAGGIIEVTWEISGVLMLPWRPKVKPWSGWTRYHLDEDGLVAFHEEGWDISTIQAFVDTILPEVGERIWGGKEQIEAA